MIYRSTNLDTLIRLMGKPNQRVYKVMAGVTYYLLAT